MNRLIRAALIVTTSFTLLTAGPASAAQIEPKISICNETEADVLRLYVAIFDREHDAKGGAYWRDTYRNGNNLDDIAYWMSQGTEYQTKYASITNNTEFVNRVYKNVFSRSSAIKGLNYWLGEMNSGLEKHLTIRWMARSPELKDRYDYRINSTCATAPAVNPPTQTSPQSSYDNCTDVWNNLGRPITRTDPGYESKLDRDNDGTGCENDPR